MFAGRNLRLRPISIEVSRENGRVPCSHFLWTAAHSLVRLNQTPSRGSPWTRAAAHAGAQRYRSPDPGIASDAFPPVAAPEDSCLPHLARQAWIGEMSRQGVRCAEFRLRHAHTRSFRGIRNRATARTRSFGDLRNAAAARTKRFAGTSRRRNARTRPFTVPPPPRTADRRRRTTPPGGCTRRSRRRTTPAAGSMWVRGRHPTRTGRRLRRPGRRRGGHQPPCSLPEADQAHGPLAAA